jgi:NADH dehydrogenase [ubiquinone] 1 alpha subcomplex assembly factor 7
VTALADDLRVAIARDGPMRLDAWMAACNAAYYAGPDPLGRDFITAPEISQMFGEMIGGWIGDLWLRAGSPPIRLVELGPGRGTLIADALRVLARLPGFDAPLALVETSPTLREAQAKQVVADWFDDLAAVPDDRPLIIIANEFFDALPVRQFLGNGQERAVDLAADGFAATTIPGDGVGEVSEASQAIAAQIGARLRAQGGAVLIIDYGYWAGHPGDSLQALRHHVTADPFAAPGDTDLTAHVDFAALARAAGDVRVSGPAPQGVWLGRLGIEARAAALKARATPGQAAAIEAALVRLTAPTGMGGVFQAMALSAPHWPPPAGFDA